MYQSRITARKREALAIVWACEHFDRYLRGTLHFQVFTDHKPLTTIWKRPKTPLKIERWDLRLQPYNLEIVYRPGKDNPADFMSKHPITTHTLSLDDVAVQYVRFVANEAIPKAIDLDEVKRANSLDKTSQKAIEYVRTGKWYKLKHLEDVDVDLLELQTIRNL